MNAGYSTELPWVIDNSLSHSYFTSIGLACEDSAVRFQSWQSSWSLDHGTLSKCSDLHFYIFLYDIQKPLITTRICSFLQTIFWVKVIHVCSLPDCVYLLLYNIKIIIWTIHHMNFNYLEGLITQFGYSVHFLLFAMLLWQLWACTTAIVFPWWDIKYASSYNFVTD